MNKAFGWPEAPLTIIMVGGKWAVYNIITGRRSVLFPTYESAFGVMDTTPLH